MLMLGPVGILSPWILLTLLVLPILWLLLRAVPPAPVKRLFPGVILLIGLGDSDSEADRTPWWLLLLRLFAIAAMVFGFSGPVLNPESTAQGGAPDMPLLVFMDNSWAAAPDWAQRIKAAQGVLDKAARQGRLAALATGSTTAMPDFVVARKIAASLSGMAPLAWGQKYEAAQLWAMDLPDVQTIWISDGLDWSGRNGLLQAFENAGPVRVLEPVAARMALRPITVSDGLIEITALRSQGAGAKEIVVLAHGPDPAGIPRELARLSMDFPAGATVAQAQLSVPVQLRNRITRFLIEGENSAGAVTLADDSLRRRRIGLAGDVSGREGLELLSPLHYLRNALTPNAEVITGAINDLILASADVIVLADVPKLGESDQRDLAKWVAQGGLLLRFAGPRLAAADTGRGVDDILLPVRLRAGGRTVGGAMSWGQARAIAPFDATSPFYGLPIPDEVVINAQVLADPGPDLAARTIATLVDGTPLVTQKTLGDGRVVLFHVTANAEWSGLPLSGLFVKMLERLAVLTPATRPDAASLVGTSWVLVETMDAFGTLLASQVSASVSGEAMGNLAHAGAPPGLYTDSNRRISVNVTGAETTLKPAIWPAHITPEWGGKTSARNLSGWLWMAALAALAVDILAALAVSGKMVRQGPSALIIAVAICLPMGFSKGLHAQDLRVDGGLISAASAVTLAYIQTGDRDVDQVSAAGLAGLSNQIFRRTSIEPAPPVGVDLDRANLSVYPLLYWVVTPSQPVPSPAAYARLRQYLASGGMILFDTRDAHVSGFGGTATPTGRRLQVLAEPLDIPPLEPVPEDHVLTRSFYLLDAFPGRHLRGVLWLEAAPADAKLAEGMPFRNLNDGVSPVMIGGNDWAAAWAIMPSGAPMFQVGRGRAGERQREMAYRFGVNLVMYVLTGNYKSDQVHVPALLERLDQ